MEKKGFIWGFAGLVVLAVVYLNAATGLRAKMEAKLSAACGRPATARSSGFLFPLGWRFSDVSIPLGEGEIGSPLKVEEVRVRVLLESVLRKDPVFSVDLVGPKFFLNWNRDVAQALSSEGGRLVKSDSLPIQTLRIRKGEMDLLDQETDPAVLWQLKGLDGSLQRDRRGRCQYKFSAKLREGEEREVGQSWLEGELISDGPFEIKITLRHERIGELGPYLRKVLGSAPERGSVELNSRITFYQGVLMAYNDVKARGVVFTTEEPTTLGLRGSRLVELLSDPSGEIRIGFIVSGRLGQELDWSDLAAGAMRQALRQAMARNLQEMVVKEGA